MPDTDEIRALARTHAATRGSLIPALQEIQTRFGYIPAAAIAIVAAELRIPASAVYGVATFYTQFRLTPRGQHLIRVCLGTACHVRGGEDILAALIRALGIEPGETTPDGLFTLEQVACLGACGLSPVMMVDDTAYGRLTVDKVPQILDGYRVAARAATKAGEVAL